LVKPEFESEYEKYREELNGINATQLQQILIALDFDYNKEFNDSDRVNPRRLIGKILTLTAIKKQWILSDITQMPDFDEKWQFYLEPIDIKERIEQRIGQRLKDGLVEEMNDLIRSGKLQIENLLSLGLEYEEFYYYFYGLTTYDEYTKGLLRQNLSYLKRQKTWFKKQNLLVKIDALDDILKITKL
jgi:tRNA A37 N6-isopentenylltransferase MiaA